LGITCPNIFVHMKFLGEQLKELREQQNLPLRKVAAYLDIDSSILSKIERGKRPLNALLIEDFAKFFKLESKELLIEYYSEEIAKNIYQEQDFAKILKVAEKKAKYLKSNFRK